MSAQIFSCRSHRLASVNEQEKNRLSFKIPSDALSLSSQNLMNWLCHQIYKTVFDSSIYGQGFLTIQFSLGVRHYKDVTFNELL